MDCQRCTYLQVLDRGSARERRCGFTGGEVSAPQTGLDWPCALQLPLATRDDRALARTVIVLAQRRGLDRELLRHYSPRQQAELVALVTEGLDVAVHERGVSEATLRDRWLEAAGL